MGTWPPDTELEDGQEQFKPLSAQEAQAWRERHRSLSLGHMLVGQALVGVLVALLAWGLLDANAGLSAGYGALVVVLPALVFVRAVARKAANTGATAAVAHLFVWELVKLMLSVALLALAPRLLPEVHWLALLAGMVLVAKTYWLGWWLHGRAGTRKTV